MVLAVGVGAAGVDAAGVGATGVEPAPRTPGAAVEEFFAALAVGAVQDVADGRDGGLDSSSCEEVGGRFGVLGSGHGEGGHGGEEEGGGELHVEGERVVCACGSS
jgi:hypothetical protein